MDIIAELKKGRCDPGPVHSPNDECPCDMEHPCSCEVDGAAIDEIMRLRAAVERKQQQYERAQRYWVDAAQKALAGDTEHLRLRVDLAVSGPIEMTETN